MKNGWKVILSAAATLCLIGVGAVGSATAAPSNAAAATVQAASADGGYTGNDPRVLEKIADLQSQGVTILSVSESQYAPVTAPTGAVAQALPSGCGLAVLVYQSGLQIQGSSMTSCNYAFSTGSMSSTMTHYNPDWNMWDSTVATGSDSLALGTYMNVELTYNCANANASNYRLTSTGIIYIQGTSYSAAAYDTFDNNVGCGT